MTTIQLTLPDQLAQEAQRAGLLSPESLEEWLRKQLKAKAAVELVAMLDKLDTAETDEDFSPEAMAEEVRAMRTERRARNSSPLPAQ
jgi:urease accessory protein UreF